MTDLPAKCKALVLNSRSEPFELKDVETPQPGSGSVIVRMEVVNVLPYASEVYTGKRNYPFPTPFVPGSAGIGHVARVGPDTTAFKEGDTVLVDVFFRARDNESLSFLFGLHDGGVPETKRLMEGEWRNATYAEYVKVPLENCTKLPKTGPTVKEMAYLPRMLVPLGGLIDISLEPGETIVIAPASGSFGGVAVEVALALGANVIAAARNSNALKTLENAMSSPRLRTVTLSGDIEADAKAIGSCDAYMDWSPPAAAKSTHIRSCLTALKPYGRASLMGGIPGTVEIPYFMVMVKSLQLRGKFMYDRSVPKRLVRLMEHGLIKVDRHKTKCFELRDWQKAFEDSAANSGWGFQTLITP